MTPAELRRAESRYKVAHARYEDARADRNRAVHAAIDAGMTHAQISEATGLTRSRVGQIALQGR